MWDSEFDDTVAEALDMMSSKERDRVATAIKVVDPEYAPLETAASGTPVGTSFVWLSHIAFAETHAL